ncbi:helix-turn-helix domain-containing protein [Saccharicrinis aurantiacus]|uniref:helix-turn-helix domain-containing protein n=1 Tax=Saccharicrinis aurantiacus TaxID=1849719 RepID=UPI0024911590|nr:helix-turn-helix domain-containing protein [Saccharicrinis aurantiacus]
MDKKKCFNTEALKRLDQLNDKVSELAKAQHKAGIGFDYVTAAELAELLGESLRTIYGRVYNKQIPFYKPGGKILLFKIEEVEKWIKSGRHSSLKEIKQNV